MPRFGTQSKPPKKSGGGKFRLKGDMARAAGSKSGSGKSANAKSF